MGHAEPPESPARARCGAGCAATSPGGRSPRSVALRPSLLPLAHSRMRRAPAAVELLHRAVCLIAAGLRTLTRGKDECTTAGQLRTSVRRLHVGDTVDQDSATCR